jgi:hypothetical protein
MLAGIDRFVSLLIANFAMQQGYRHTLRLHVKLWNDAAGR